jgi:hypothetical protein
LIGPPKKSPSKPNFTLDLKRITAASAESNQSYRRLDLEINIPDDKEECKITRRSRADSSYRALVKEESEKKSQS